LADLKAIEHFFGSYHNLKIIKIRNYEKKIPTK
jgi:hypothetical protein